METLIYFLGSGVIAAIISYFLQKPSFQPLNRDEEIAKAKQAVRPQIENMKEATKKQKAMMKESLKEEEEVHQERLETINATIEIKSNALGRKTERLNDVKKSLDTLKGAIKELEKSNTEMESSITEAVESRASMTRDEAIESLKQDIEQATRDLKDSYCSKEAHAVKDDLERISKRHVKFLVQRFSDETSVEHISTNVVIPRDKMKGMLIGAGGSNILYLENLFPNVDFVFNDQKNTLTITGFNLLQRHMAKVTIHALLSERAISPAKIKKAYDKAKALVDRDIMRTGNRALKKIGIKGISKELTWLTGRLKFRRSYGQNILKHSLEVAFFAEMIAAEIGCDTETAKIAAFFHDIGKAIDHDIDTDEGHDYLTKEILEKEGMSYEIVHAAWVHHDAAPQETPEAHIIKAADAMSAGRPGARQETLESYLERIKALEEIARGMSGVKKSYAVSAGREMRLFVDPKMINDKKLQELADDTAGKIEQSVTYPGKIKVMVIRKSRAQDMAQ